jgi:hypothetical protein
MYLNRADAVLLLVCLAAGAGGIILRESGPRRWTCTLVGYQWHGHGSGSLAAEAGLRVVATGATGVRAMEIIVALVNMTRRWSPCPA